MIKATPYPVDVVNDDLVTLDFNPVVPYDNSLFCVDARDFEQLIFTEWIDKVTDTPFAVTTGTPTVIDVGGTKMVRTKGTSRLDRQITVANPHTLIFKGAPMALATNMPLVAGYGSSQPIFGLAGTTNFSFYAGNQVVPSPAITPSASGVLTAVLSYAGASGAMWINGVKTSGNIGSFIRAGIRAGVNASAAAGFDVAYAHLQLVAGACTDAFAAQILADLS